MHLMTGLISIAIFSLVLLTDRTNGIPGKLGGIFGKSSCTCNALKVDAEAFNSALSPIGAQIYRAKIGSIVVGPAGIYTDGATAYKLANPKEAAADRTETYLFVPDKNNPTVTGPPGAGPPSTGPGPIFDKGSLLDNDRGFFCTNDGGGMCTADGIAVWPGTMSDGETYWLITNFDQVGLKDPEIYAFGKTITSSECPWDIGGRWNFFDVETVPGRHYAGTSLALKCG